MLVLSLVVEVIRSLWSVVPLEQAQECLSPANMHFCSTFVRSRTVCSRLYLFCVEKNNKKRIGSTYT